MNRLDRLKIHAGRWGWPRALYNVVIRGAARYLGIHLYIVRVRRFPEEPTYPATNPDLVIRKIEEAELPELCKDPDLGIRRAFAEKAVLRGDIVFGAFDGPRLVSYIWRAADSAPDVGDIWVRVDRPYNYSYKSYTRPAYRGQRIGPVVHLFSDNEMRKLGYEYRAGFVSVSNFSSLRMGKHMGSEKIGYAGYAVLFGRLFQFRTKAVKAIGFEFYRPDDLR